MWRRPWLRKLFLSAVCVKEISKLVGQPVLQIDEDEKLSPGRLPDELTSMSRVVNGEETLSRNFLPHHLLEQEMLLDLLLQYQAGTESHLSPQLVLFFTVQARISDPSLFQTLTNAIWLMYNGLALLEAGHNRSSDSTMFENKLAEEIRDTIQVEHVWRILFLQSSGRKASSPCSIFTNVVMRYNNICTGSELSECCSARLGYFEYAAFALRPPFLRLAPGHRLYSKKREEPPIDELFQGCVQITFKEKTSTNLGELFFENFDQVQEIMKAWKLKEGDPTLEALRYIEDNKASVMSWLYMAARSSDVKSSEDQIQLTKLVMEKYDIRFDKCSVLGCPCIMDFDKRPKKERSFRIKMGNVFTAVEVLKSDAGKASAGKAASGELREETVVKSPRHIFMTVFEGEAYLGPCMSMDVYRLFLIWLYIGYCLGVLKKDPVF